MTEVDVALAVSPRDWSDALHQFLVDHGGARVRAHVMAAEDALSEDYQVLVIDDFCSFLTPRLVALLQRNGKTVLGVWDPDEFADGKQRLVEAGVDSVIEASASPDEFLFALRAVAVVGETPRPESPAPRAERSRHSITVVGGPGGGAGTTEVAIALARWFTDRRRRAVLVDGDDVAPSVAQRLGLPLQPNLRSAIDSLQQRSPRFESTLHALPALSVLTGLANRRDWSEVRPSDAVDLVVELAGRGPVVVNIAGQLDDLPTGGWSARFGLTRALLGTADRLVAVGLPTPVGVTRLAQWVIEAVDIRPGISVQLAVNRSPRSRFRRAEVAAELRRLVKPAGIWFLPEDEAVARASWQGTPVSRSSFPRAVARLGHAMEGAV
jgi:MinD-like ATPase involved in chromosome partitioning or flagellar assembly